MSYINVVKRIISNNVLKVGIPYTVNHLRLKKLKNRFKGETCFVIGNGPSLQIADLQKIHDEGYHSIASNKIYLAFEKTNWRPNYYTISDYVVAENNKNYINELNIKKIVTYGMSDIFDPKDNRFMYYNFSKNEVGTTIKDYKPFFSKNIMYEVGGGYSVTFVNLQLAYYLGFNKVILIGVDFSFKTPKKIIKNKYYGEALVSEGESNHFLPNYREKGETWTMPRLDLQEIAFRKAKKVFELDNRTILNASRETKLEVFDKMELDQILN